MTSPTIDRATPRIPDWTWSDIQSATTTGVVAMVAFAIFQTLSTTDSSKSLTVTPYTIGAALAIFAIYKATTRHSSEIPPLELEEQQADGEEVLIFSKAKLLSQSNYNAFLKRPLNVQSAILMLCDLSDIFKLSQQQFENLLQYSEEQAFYITLGLMGLEEKGLLSENNIEAFLESPALGTGIESLRIADLLTQAHLNILFDHSHLDEVFSYLLRIMSCAAILTETHFKQLLRFTEAPEALPMLNLAIRCLEIAHLLEPENIERFLRSPESISPLFMGTSFLHHNDLLSQESLDLLSTSPEQAFAIAHALVTELKGNDLGYLHAQGENVHSREEQVRDAFIKLKEDQALDQDLILKLAEGFRDYLHLQEASLVKFNALYVLEGESRDKKMDLFPALIGPQDPWSIAGLELTGEEILARLWMFIHGLPDPKDFENAKLSMISSLADSIDEGMRICNTGKMVELVVGVLQGNVPGLEIDPVEKDEVDPTDAINFFFSNPEVQAIDKTDLLLQRGNEWLQENPHVRQPEQFLDALREVAKQGDFDSPALDAGKQTR